MHELYRAHKIVQYSVQATFIFCNLCTCLKCRIFFFNLQLKQIYIFAQIYTDI